MPEAQSSIGAVGSALVLCTKGPGFEPLMEHTLQQLLLVSLVGQDSRLSPDRPGFKSRTRKYYIILASIAQLGERQTEDLKVPRSIRGGGI